MNPAAAFASTLVDELVRHGIRDAVLSPGSRSAPLAYALQEADRAGRLRLHVRVDERTAAFLALGLAKATRVPVPIVVTSGTAVANLHPAVLEASHAQVPLIVLSADRPPELRGTGANQTTDQVRIFGGATRWFHDLGTPEARPGQGALWRSVASRAVAHARGVPSGEAGPVHLNLPFRAPLVPTGGDDWTDSLEGRPGGAPWAVATPAVPDGGDTIAAVPRTLAVLGDVPDPAQAARFTRLAESAGWPVLAEPFGAFHSTRVLPHGPLVLQATRWVQSHLPDRVLVGGRPTLDRGLAQLLRHPDIELEVVSSGGSWADPSHAVRRVHDWGALDSAHGSVAGCADRVWADAWRSVGERLAAAVGPVIDGSWPSGFAASRVIAHALPVGSGLFVGSSSAARYLDLARDSGQVARDVVSVANRGLAGIDGSVSSAIGFALTRGGRPSYAVLGDLTFAHDANGLLIGPDEPRPDLTIVVLNDDGGGIFGTLEPGAGASGGSLAGVDASYERVFGTPTRVSIEGLCAAYGVPHQLIQDADALAERIANPARGIHVAEVRFDRALQRGLQERLFEVTSDVLP
ncbi:2-succinyl-5-enolpyruvyl-6-hydroxy-3-cyclohexene-1-carboxylic-acid synthase [Allobranchiibius sp. CTAmp26]|uniref:2-succinyl-5-enolpyruvyl-6-hydroxy-3- cyclohexene-1-carboxylic-acid synthase n=1 Tax=Allobranchiibius sp. CTAmp26 TaxID=2815214 RepID=UPI0027DC2F43|nr:2-succinyl-5-enolpyruvyl-6-hydroxy-3-cyclohexene-1-carboxylic-acid synthase [Allobranchiibius sp. CTAmp26]